MSWKAADRYSKDYIDLRTKDKVSFYKTPDAILRTQLDGLGQDLRGQVGRENPMFKRVLESQKAFAERACRYGFDYQRRLPDGVQPLLRPSGRRAAKGAAKKA